MKIPQGFVPIMAGALLVAAASGEHVFRRVIEYRYRRALESRQELEVRFGQAMASRERIRTQLSREQQRSHALAEALASARSQLEQAVGRLSQETGSVRELRMRLGTMQSQMDQLQGELALALQRTTGTDAAAQQPVQLERILVSTLETPGLRGRVLSVHPEWNFVLIDLGWNVVNIGDTLSIVRNGQMLAKARVERVQEGVCAATLLPESEIAKVQINDAVQIL